MFLILKHLNKSRTVVFHIALRNHPHFECTAAVSFTEYSAEGATLFCYVVLRFCSIYTAVKDI